METDENVFSNNFHIISLGEMVIIDNNGFIVKRLNGNNLAEELNNYVDEYFK